MEVIRADRNYLVNCIYTICNYPNGGIHHEANLHRTDTQSEFHEAEHR